MNIDWSLLRSGNTIGEAAQQGWREGRAQSAMRTLAHDPSNRDALAGLYEVDPANAYRMETVGRERMDWQRKQTALDAQRAYIASRYGGSAPATPDALAAPQAPMPNVLGAPGQLPPMSGSLPAPVAGPPAVPPTAPSFYQPARPALPHQQGATDSAWLNYAMADPVGAMKARQDETEWQSSRLKLSKAELEEHHAVNTEAMRLLNGVTDQASYDRARTDAERLYAQYGYDFPDLPAEYHPELVKALQFRAMEYKDVIASDLAERKFGWQQQDDRIDNARDDHRVAIQDRSQRDESARGWSRDRRDERRYQRGDQVTIDDPTGRLIGALRND